MVPIEMRWRHVLFENYPVDPATVAARLPDALAVDTFDGQAWLSVVPFVNADVRPRGLPATLGLDLPELNLRTYVTCDGEPGVYFFSLDADGLLGVVGARLLNHLPYYTLGMDGTVRYANIDHDPWTLAPASVETETNTLFGADGFETPDGEPVVYYGAEIEVTATASRRW